MIVDTGGAGGLSAGVFLHTTASCLVTANTLDGIVGGRGGVSGSSYSGSGGVGGIGAGLYLEATSDSILAGNAVAVVSGGEHGEESEYPQGAQEGFGIYLTADAPGNRIHTTNTLADEPIIYLYGAEGATVRDLRLVAPANPTNWGKIAVLQSHGLAIVGNVVEHYTGEYGRSGASAHGSGVAGRGGNATAIRIQECTECVVSANAVSSVRGGQGGAGGWRAGAGDAGDAVGIYASGADLGVMEGNTVREVVGGRHGRGSPDYDSSFPGAAFGVHIVDSLGMRMSRNRVIGVDAGSGAIAPREARAACILVDRSAAAALESLSCHSVGQSGTGPGHGVITGPGQSSPVAIVHAIIANVTGYCLYNESGASAFLSVGYSDLYECAEGEAYDAIAGEPYDPDVDETCISEDPMFEAPESGNLHLESGSPCIDRGSPESDCSIEPRPNGCRVNMGAYGNTDEATSGDEAEHCETCPPEETPDVR